tara:strand:- start:188 stop:475 length:288 start_codon:yes stop_codon:yes gene_type:complete
MHTSGKNSDHKKRKIREGSLVRVHNSQDIRLRFQDPDVGHLSDVFFGGEGIVGVVTKLWPDNIYYSRELELMSSGEFFIVSSNNGFEIKEIEVLS